MQIIGASIIKEEELSVKEVINVLTNGKKIYISGFQKQVRRRETTNYELKHSQ